MAEKIKKQNDVGEEKLNSEELENVAGGHTETLYTPAKKITHLHEDTPGGGKIDIGGGTV